MATEITPVTVAQPLITAIEPLKVIADIIQEEMDLDDGRVMVYNQRVELPKDHALFILVTPVSRVAIGSNSYPADSEGGLAEIQELAMQELVQIDIMSFGDEARIRAPEVIMALTSQYAERQSEDNLVQLARIPGQLTDVSDLEAASRLNRYTMTITIKALYRKTKAVDYFNVFQDVEIHPDPKPE